MVTRSCRFFPGFSAIKMSVDRDFYPRVRISQSRWKARIIRHTRHYANHVALPVAHPSKCFRNGSHHPFSCAGQQMVPCFGYPLANRSRPIGVDLDVRPHNPNDRPADDWWHRPFSAQHDHRDHTAGADIIPVVMENLTWILLIALLGGCAPSNESGQTSRPDAEQIETVVLTVQHRSEWRVLWIEGETNLPDGAYLNYRVTHELGQATPTENWPAGNLIEAGRAAVLNGKYWTKINTLNWPSGLVTILVQFPLPPQPPEVIERYGAFGEYLAGDNVSVLNGMQAVEIEHTLEHRR